MEEAGGEINIRCDEEEVVDETEEEGLGGVQEVQDVALKFCVEVITEKTGEHRALRDAAPLPEVLLANAHEVIADMLVEEVEQAFAVVLAVLGVHEHRVPPTTDGAAGEGVWEVLRVHGWRGPADKLSLHLGDMRRLPTCFGVSLWPLGSEFIGWPEFDMLRDMVCLFGDQLLDEADEFLLGDGIEARLDIELDKVQRWQLMMVLLLQELLLEASQPEMDISHGV